MRRLVFALAVLLPTLVHADSDDSQASDMHDADATVITVNKSPSCGCCKLWIAHLEEAGFQVNPLDSDDMTAIKERYGVPENMRSCHTAIVDGYVIEGHVPASDIRQLLAEKPDATGIAVPGMPLGSPGMEVPGRIDDYKVMLFDENGFSVYKDYPAPDTVASEGE
ncbi:MAG: DUF411 domain-containing protein [Pseudomonadota bacterium]